MEPEEEKTKEKNIIAGIGKFLGALLAFFLILVGATIGLIKSLPNILHIITSLISLAHSYCNRHKYKAKSKAFLARSDFLFVVLDKMIVLTKKGYSTEDAIQILVETTSDKEITTILTSITDKESFSSVLDKFVVSDLSTDD